MPLTCTHDFFMKMGASQKQFTEMMFFVNNLHCKDFFLVMLDLFFVP